MKGRTTKGVNCFKMGHRRPLGDRLYHRRIAPELYGERERRSSVIIRSCRPRAHALDRVFDAAGDDDVRKAQAVGRRPVLHRQRRAAEGGESMRDRDYDFGLHRSRGVAPVENFREQGLCAG